MQTTTVTRLETHPAILATILSGFTVAHDWADGEAEIRRLLDASPEPLFLIDDVREMNMTFDDLVASASLGSRGQDPLWHHPKMRSVYFITGSKIIEAIAAGLNSPVFGNVHVKVFASVEEALQDIDQVTAAAA